MSINRAAAHERALELASQTEASTESGEYGLGRADDFWADAIPGKEKNLVCHESVPGRKKAARIPQYHRPDTTTERV